MLRLDIEKGQEIERVEILPFKVEYEGEAKCEDYLYGKVDLDQNEQQWNGSTFGRAIKGKDVQIDGCQKLLVVDLVQNEDGSKVVSSIAQTQKLRYWNHDSNCKPTDQVVQNLALVNVIHDMEQEVTIQSI